MALFGRGDKGAGASDNHAAETLPLVGHKIYCRVCDGERMLTRCWRRAAPVRRCPCCNLDFEDVSALYRAVVPACPRCNEPLEQPGFDYGLCDGCGSKYEIVEGTKPGLLPNRQQRAEMDKHGKTRSVR